MIYTWQILARQKKYSSIPFNVSEITYDKPDHGKFTASVLEMPNWVNIIAVNSKNEVLLIKQFRFGTNTVELEIPGGVIEPNEEPINAAIRELEEETGYITTEIYQIGAVNANPAIQNNKCFTFLAKNIKPTGHTHFDPDEMIEHEFASLDQCKKYIQEGKITNCYIIAAFYWLFLNTKS